MSHGNPLAGPRRTAPRRESPREDRPSQRLEMDQQEEQRDNDNDSPPFTRQHQQQSFSDNTTVVLDPLPPPAIRIAPLHACEHAIKIRSVSMLKYLLVEEVEDPSELFCPALVLPSPTININKNSTNKSFASPSSRIFGNTPTMVTASSSFANVSFQQQQQQHQQQRTTLLHLAIEQGDVRLVEALVLVGANCWKPNTDGLTPLHVALDFLPECIVPLLLDFFAGPNDGTATITDTVDMSTARSFLHDVLAFVHHSSHSPLSSPSSSSSHHFPRAEIVAALLDLFGADILAADGTGTTAHDVLNEQVLLCESGEATNSSFTSPAAGSCSVETAAHIFQLMLSASDAATPSRRFGRSCSSFFVHPLTRVSLLVVLIAMQLMMFMGDFYTRNRSGSSNSSTTTTTNASSHHVIIAVGHLPVDMPFVFRVVDMLASTWPTVGGSAEHEEELLLSRSLCVALGFLVGALFFAFPLHWFLRDVCGLRMFGSEIAMTRQNFDSPWRQRRQQQPAAKQQQKHEGETIFSGEHEKSSRHSNNNTKRRTNNNNNNNRALLLLRSARLESTMMGSALYHAFADATDLPPHFPFTRKALPLLLMRAALGEHQQQRYLQEAEEDTADLVATRCRWALATLGAWVGMFCATYVNERVADDIFSSSSSSTNNTTSSSSSSSSLYHPLSMTGAVSFATATRHFMHVALYCCALLILSCLDSMLQSVATLQFLPSASHGYVPSRKMLRAASAWCRHRVAYSIVLHVLVIGGLATWHFFATSSLYCCRDDEDTFATIPLIEFPHIFVSLLFASSCFFFDVVVLCQEWALPNLQCITIIGRGPHHHHGDDNRERYSSEFMMERVVQEQQQQQQQQQQQSEQQRQLSGQSNHEPVVTSSAAGVQHRSGRRSSQSYGDQHDYSSRHDDEREEKDDDHHHNTTSTSDEFGRCGEMSARHAFFLPAATMLPFVRGNVFAWFLFVWMVKVVIDLVFVSWYIQGSVDYFDQQHQQSEWWMVLAFVGSLLPLCFGVLAFLWLMVRNSTRVAARCSTAASFCSLGGGDRLTSASSALSATSIGFGGGGSGGGGFGDDIIGGSGGGALVSSGVCVEECCGAVEHYSQQQTEQNVEATTFIATAAASSASYIDSSSSPNVPPTPQPQQQQQKQKQQQHGHDEALPPPSSAALLDHHQPEDLEEKETAPPQQQLDAVDALLRDQAAEIERHKRRQRLLEELTSGVGGGGGSGAMMVETRTQQPEETIDHHHGHHLHRPDHHNDTTAVPTAVFSNNSNSRESSPSPLSSTARARKAQTRVTNFAENCGVWNMCLCGHVATLREALSVDPNLVTYVGGPGLRISLKELRPGEDDYRCRSTELDLRCDDHDDVNKNKNLVWDVQLLEDTEDRDACRLLDGDDDCDEGGDQRRKKHTRGADAFGATLLHYAVFAGDPRMVAMLVSNGSNIAARTNCGALNSVELARAMGKKAIAKWLETSHRAMSLSSEDFD